MKRVLVLALAVIMVLCFAACGSSSKDEPAPAPAPDAGSAAVEETPEVAEGETFNFRVASGESETTKRYLMFEKPIMDLITEKSGGRITFTFYPSSTLAPTNQHLTALQDGLAEMAFCSVSNNPGVFLYNELMLMPGIDLGSTLEEKSKSVQAFLKEYSIDEFEKNDLYLIGACPASYVSIYSKFPIESVDSFGGRMMCAPPAYQSMFNDIKDVGMTWVVPPEQYEAAHLSIIDAIMNAMGPISAYKLYELLDYSYEAPFVMVPTWCEMSLAAYNSLPDDLKQVLDEIQCSDELYEINKAYVESEIAETEAEATSNNENFVFTTLPDDVSDVMKAAALDAIQEKVKQLNDAGLDGDGAYEFLMSLSAK